MTATYDDAAQRVTLSSRAETAAPVTVGADTSGFLAAVKLDATAQSTGGERPISASGSALVTMTEYAGVTAGTVTVNGQGIAIDPGTTTLRELVSALDGIAAVSATLDETTGAIRIASRRPGGTLTVSDSSGVLAALGIATGTHRGTPGETVTEPVAPSSGITVAARVSGAVADLDEALSQLGKASGALAVRAQVESAVRHAVDALRDAGARGVSVSSTAGETRLAMDREAFASALTDQLGAPAGLGAIDRALTQFARTLAVVAEPPRREDPITELGAKVKARLPADQISGMQLLLRPPLPPRPPEASAVRRAAEAYAEGQEILATGNPSPAERSPDRSERRVERRSFIPAGEE